MQSIFNGRIQILNTSDSGANYILDGVFNDNEQAWTPNNIQVGDIVIADTSADGSYPGSVSSYKVVQILTPDYDGANIKLELAYNDGDTPIDIASAVPSAYCMICRPSPIAKMAWVAAEDSQGGFSPRLVTFANNLIRQAIIDPALNEFLKSKVNSTTATIYQFTPVAEKSDGSIEPCNLGTSDGEKFYGVVTADIISNTSGLVQIEDILQGACASLNVTPETPIFLNDSGALSLTPSSTPGNLIFRVGYATGASGADLFINTKIIARN